MTAINPIQQTASPAWCPSCGAECHHRRAAGTAYEILECSECSTAVTFPSDYVTCSSYEEETRLAEGYVHAEAFGKKYSRSLLLRLPQLTPTRRLLDVGCSIGTLVDVATHAGFDAEGIDLDGNAIAYGKRLGRRVEKTAISSWTGGDYGVITLQHTLEHVRDVLEFIQACSERIATDGMLAAVVPCHAGLLPRTFPRWWYGWQPEQHYYHYTKPGLEKLFRRAGLTIVKSVQYSMDHRPRFSSFRTPKRAIKSLACFSVATVGGWIGKGDQVLVVGRKATNEV